MDKGFVLSLVKAEATVAERLLRQTTREVFCLQAQGRSAGTPRWDDKLAPSLVHDGRGFDSRLLIQFLKIKPIGLRRHGFVFEYWGRQSLLNNLLEPA